MSNALPRPGVVPVFAQWTWQPVAVVAVIALGWWYARAAREHVRRGHDWPRRRAVTFGLGLVLAVWTSCGFLQVYVRSLYWVWTTQVLTLWLLVPAILLAGQPLQLAVAVHGPDTWLARALHTRPARILSNPLVGPALVPILSGVLFFGPVPQWGAFTPAFGWILQPVLVILGAVLLLPLLGIDERPGTLAVALSLAIGSFELVLDAIPGIVLRLHRGLVSGYFDHRVLHPWSRTHLQDQQTAGSVLWVIAELIDLPFLLLVFRQWLRADARDAAAMDAVLDAEHAARAGMADESQPEGTGDADAPWWLSDPEWQRRMRGQP
ncbi:MAG TPA: cytochrome c oxidase assembly protein [Jatrophihabitantaceae bacterium]|jgi:cytochrome c oxidase assembly factor CtaG|nr:cytochrome c oxidase assembly protein [Jatrophihabitantaceae bacterium]